MRTNVGLVGIGKLGAALMHHWNENNISIGVFHRDNTKAKNFVHQFPNGYILTESKLREADVIILALPAKTIIPFITNLGISNNTGNSPIIVNMATALPTKEIIKLFSTLSIFGLKYMGHAKDLLDHGNGLFISEVELPGQIEELFMYLGKVKIDSENSIAEVNKLATYYALNSAIKMEAELTKKGYPSEYVNRALTSIVPEVIRSYCERTLGHFASEIAKDIQNKKDNKDR